MVHEPNSKIVEALDMLRQQNPGATDEELRYLFTNLANTDEGLKEACLENLFYRTCDELYDELPGKANQASRCNCPCLHPTNRQEGVQPRTQSRNFRPAPLLDSMSSRVGAILSLDGSVA
jgi:hypothetical protein